MYGPAFDKAGEATGKLVEREVPDADVPAFEAVGYKPGKLTPELIAADKAATKEIEDEAKATAKQEKEDAKKK
jgi:hypothetical protein